MKSIIAACVFARTSLRLSTKNSSFYATSQKLALVVLSLYLCPNAQLILAQQSQKAKLKGNVSDASRDASSTLIVKKAINAFGGASAIQQMDSCKTEVTLTSRDESIPVTKFNLGRAYRSDFHRQAGDETVVVKPGERTRLSNGKTHSIMGVPSLMQL